jgi:hypothetical protein
MSPFTSASFAIFMEWLFSYPHAAQQYPPDLEDRLHSEPFFVIAWQRPYNNLAIEVKINAHHFSLILILYIPAS